MNTRSFQHDDFGAGAIIGALREARANPGTLACFDIADHPARGGKLHAFVAVGFETNGPDGKASWRHAGEGMRLDGAGSHALIPTWYDDQSVEHAAAALALQVARYGPEACIFRMRGLAVAA